MEFWAGVVFGFAGTIVAEVTVILIYANSKGGKK